MFLYVFAHLFRQIQKHTNTQKFVFLYVYELVA